MSLKNTMTITSIICINSNALPDYSTGDLSGRKDILG